MIFWIGILVGGVSAWYAVRLGFLEVWTTLFNIVVSIYVAVFSTLAVAEGIPAAGETSFGHCFTMAAVGIGTFLILGGISYTFLTGRFKVTFPKIFDNVASGVLGFFAGVLVWSFLALLLSVTPLARSGVAQSLGIGGSSQQTHVQYVSWWCDWIGRLSSRRGQGSTERMIAEIADKATRKQRQIEDQKKQPPRTEPEPSRLSPMIEDFGSRQDIGHAPLAQGPPPQGPPAI